MHQSANVASNSIDDRCPHRRPDGRLVVFTHSLQEWALPLNDRAPESPRPEGRFALQKLLAPFPVGDCLAEPKQDAHAPHHQDERPRRRDESLAPQEVEARQALQVRPQDHHVRRQPTPLVLKFHLSVIRNQGDSIKGIL